MPVLNMVQSINRTLLGEMSRNKEIVLLGEDVGRNGGVFRATEGLIDAFGPDRVVDTPLAEDAIVGTALGMALYGLQPVVEMQFLDFIYPAFNQIVSELSKFRYRSGGQYPVHVVIRAPYGGGIKGGHYHSQSTEAYFIHTPGLFVVTPSTPYDAKGLLLTALRSKDPIIFLEPKRIYRTVTGEVPEEDYAIPLGKAKFVREGSDVTVISWGASVHACARAADLASKEGIRVELIDLRSLLPFDIGAIVGSVRKTGKVVVVHEATRIGGFGAEVAAQIAERALDSLRAPILRVAGFDTPFPYAHENIYLPTPERVLRAVKKVFSY